MCGITAINTHDNAISYLLESLKVLEYRGYDSTGISYLNHEFQVETTKCKGKIEVLSKKVNNKALSSLLGIGHTRWATHGEVNDINAHPHNSFNNDFSIVHNGIIENYLVLKEELIKEGYCFKSKTDSEVIVHLLDKFYGIEKNILKAFKKTVEKLDGSYAIALISNYDKDTIYLTKNRSPLIVGKIDNATIATSDIPTITKYTNEIYHLDDFDFALLKKDRILFYNHSLEEISKTKFIIKNNFIESNKKTDDHYMLKEIKEQSTIIENIINTNELEKDLNHLSTKLDKFNKIYLIACGTANHACLSGAYYLEKLTKKQAIAITASEFRYCDPLLDEFTLCIFVSQSGETADTLAALSLAKQQNITTLSIVNVAGSSLDLQSDYRMYSKAGSEIAVASTKAYTAQLMTLLLFSIYYAKQINKTIDDTLEKDLIRLPNIIKELINDSKWKDLSDLLISKKDAYFIGRLLDYHVALEGALKLKEISYIHADAYLAGELKHGPIALIEEDTIVFAIATQKEIIKKTISNIEEIKARKGKVVIFTTDESIKDAFDHVVLLEELHSFLMPVISIIPLQLISYYITLTKGLDVDKPRNLAKSVTVE